MYRFICYDEVEPLLTTTFYIRMCVYDVCVCVRESVCVGGYESACAWRGPALASLFTLAAAAAAAGDRDRDAAPGSGCGGRRLSAR